MTTVRAFAPGRVNLIGEHTDYTDGLVLPMAVHLGTTVTVVRGGHRVTLVSSTEPDTADIDLRALPDPSALSQIRPAWARFVAGVIAELRPAEGGRGEVHSTLPIGAGLSSSTSFTLAVALALGFAGSPLELALAGQRIEQVASGVPCGIMDQLVAAAGVPGAALLIDCRSLAWREVPIPDDVEVVVVHSGDARLLVDSAYAQRRAECEAAAAVIGPLRDASTVDTGVIADDTVRRRARHVVSENGRVLAFADALMAGDVAGAGRLMLEGHRSLAADFEVSTPALDATVAELAATPGVYGARLTGAGFGGCVVALTRVGALTGPGGMAAPGSGRQAWIVRPSGGAHRETID